MAEQKVEMMAVMRVVPKADWMAGQTVAQKAR